MDKQIKFKYKLRKYLILIIVEVFLLAIIVLLAIKILNIYKDNVKGVQVVNINKEYVEFDSTNSNLKYFFEPKPSTNQTWNPDWLGYEVKNTINKDSLNERYDYAIEKDKRTFRIITLGDSFTFGQYVNTNENYSELLEDMLNQKLKCDGIKKFEVINLGVYGYDLEYTVERFLKRGIKYNPNLVIWLLIDGDFNKINEIIIPKMNQLKNKGIPEYIKINDKVQYFRIVRAIADAYKNLPDEYLYSYQYNVLNRLITKYDDKFLFLSLKPFEKKYENLINNFVNTYTNFKFFDHLLVNYFSNTLYRLPDSHPNKIGHEKIAENIFDYLLRSNLINCSH